MPAGMKKRRPVHHRPSRVIERQHCPVQRQILRPAGAVGLRHLEQRVAIGPQPLEMLFWRLKPKIFPLNHVPVMFFRRGFVKLVRKSERGKAKGPPA